jgi:hypothetical protein
MIRHHLFYALIPVALAAAALHAQAPNPPATGPTAAPGKEIAINATAANVKDAGSPVKIRIFRWSTEEERGSLVTALTAPPPAPRGNAGGRGGNAAAGRGGGRGRGGEAAAPLTPIQALAAALQKVPTVGYLWTTDVTGYSIKYAWRAVQPDRSERIVLVTDRRLGAHSPGWTLTAPGTPNDHEFTLIELRLDAKGGEGKASLTTGIAADKDARLLSLENAAAAPTVLTNIKRASS